MWTPGLTKQETYQIERVQKCALHVILGEDYLSYDFAIKALDVEKLSDRRAKLSLNFAKNFENTLNTQNGSKKQKYLHPPRCPLEVTKMQSSWNTPLCPQGLIDIKPHHSHIWLTCWIFTIQDTSELNLYLSCKPTCKKWIIARKTFYWTSSSYCSHYC